MPGAELSRVFVSFAPQDAAFAQTYIAGLRASGIDVWFDAELLTQQGAAWQAVYAELSTRDVYIVILSPAALASERVNAEIDAALDLVAQGHIQLFLPATAVSCQAPLLLRRYKRIEGQRGAPVGPGEAVARTLRTLRDPAAGKPVPIQVGGLQRQPARAQSLFFRANIVVTLVILIGASLTGIDAVWSWLPLAGHAFVGYNASEDLHSVQMLSTSDGWAVGQDGTILRYASGEWRWQSSPTRQELWRVRMSADGTDGWVVGEHGTILRYTHGAWTVQAGLPDDESFKGIAMFSPDEGWAVGERPGKEDQTIWHYQAGRWTLASLQAPGALCGCADLDDIAMTSPADGWAVGDRALAHYDGRQWTLVSTLGEEWGKGVVMLSPTAGWAVTSQNPGGTVLRYDGHVWSAVHQLDPEVASGTLTGVAVAPGGGVWVVGESFGQLPNILRSVQGNAGALDWVVVRGSYHSALSTTSLAPQVESISMPSDGDGWAVGAKGTIIHVLGDHWTLYNFGG